MDDQQNISQDDDKTTLAQPLPASTSPDSSTVDVTQKAGDSVPGSSPVLSPAAPVPIQEQTQQPFQTYTNSPQPPTYQYPPQQPPAQPYSNPQQPFYQQSQQQAPQPGYSPYPGQQPQQQAPQPVYPPYPGQQPPQQAPQPGYSPFPGQPQPQQAPQPGYPPYPGQQSQPQQGYPSYPGQLQTQAPQPGYSPYPVQQPPQQGYQPYPVQQPPQSQQPPLYAPVPQPQPQYQPQGSHQSGFYPQAGQPVQPPSGARPRSKTPMLIAVASIILVLAIVSGIIFIHPFSSKPADNGSHPTQANTPKPTPTPVTTSSDDPGNTHNLTEEKTLSTSNIASVKTDQPITLSSNTYSMTVSKGVIYVILDKLKSIQALNPKTGKQIWSINTKTTASSITVVKDVMYYGDDEELVAVNTIDGSTIWTAPFSTPGSSSSSSTNIFKKTSDVVIAKGIVFVASSLFHKIYAFNIKDGTQLWTASILTPTAASISNPSADPAAQTVYFCGFGQLSAYDITTGNKLWNKSLSDANAYIVPIVAYSKVYIVTQNKLQALDGKTGDSVWSSKQGFIRPNIAISDNKVFVNSGSTDKLTDTVQAYDAETGSLLWTSDAFGHQGDSFSIGTLTVANGIVYGTIFDYKTSSPFKIFPGTLLAFDMGSGKKLWSYNPPSKLVELTGIENGTIYVTLSPTYDASAPSTNNDPDQIVTIHN